jgi:cell division protein FtsB
MYAQKRPIENMHIIRERDRRRFRELLSVLSLVIPLGLFLLLFTWQNLEVIRLGREASSLQKEREKLANANRDLRLELERLTSLDTVEEKAAKLGFVRTESARMVIVLPQGAHPDTPLQGQAQ